MTERILAVVFDLEFTAWPGSQERHWTGPGEHREIVQIGAVRVVPDGEYTEVASFSALICPILNPRLSRYFVDLTGITQDALDRDGVGFSEALDRFMRFAGDNGPIYSNGPDMDVMVENCRLYGLDVALPVRRYVNVGPHLAERAGRKGHISSGTLADYFPGVPHLPAHNALSDARMVAAALGCIGYAAADGPAL